MKMAAVKCVVEDVVRVPFICQAKRWIESMPTWMAFELLCDLFKVSLSTGSCLRLMCWMTVVQGHLKSVERQLSKNIPISLMLTISLMSLMTMINIKPVYF